MSVPTALPANWARFIDSVLIGTNPADAARALGFSNPAMAAAELLRTPQVRKALVAAGAARLECEGLPLALDVVNEILTDRDPKARAVRAKLAVAVLDRVLGKPEKEQAPNPADMSRDQLHQLVAQLQASGVRPGEMLNVTPEPKGDAGG